MSNVFRTVEYQPEDCLLEFTKHCEIPVHLPALALQPTRDVNEGVDEEEGIV